MSRGPETVLRIISLIHLENVKSVEKNKSRGDQLNAIWFFIHLSPPSPPHEILNLYKYYIVSG